MPVASLLLAATLAAAPPAEAPAETQTQAQAQAQAQPRTRTRLLTHPHRREGPSVTLGFGVGAVITDGAERFGGDGYITNGRFDMTLAYGLNDYVTLGLTAHYTPRFERRLLSAQGVGARIAVFPWRGLLLSITPNLDWVPLKTQDAYTVAPGGYGAIGWEWRIGSRLGLTFDVGLNLRGVPGDGGMVVGGYNRLSLTWYRR